METIEYRGVVDKSKLPTRGPWVKKYFGLLYRLGVFLGATAVIALLYAAETHHGGPHNGSSGFAMGFGIYWILLVEDRS